MDFSDPGATETASASWEIFYWRTSCQNGLQFLHPYLCHHCTVTSPAREAEICAFSHQPLVIEQNCVKGEESSWVACVSAETQCSLQSLSAEY